MDSNYYGSLIEHGVCSNDIWIADHDFGYQICNAGYSDFFDFLAKVALNVWDDEGGSSRKMRGKRNEQRLLAARPRVA
jgi:predicted N-acyltransferase